MKENNFIRKFSKNKSALFGFCYVSFICLMAVFAYAFAPDNTVDANLQIPELRAKPPGYSQTFMYVPSGNVVHNKLLTGKHDPGKWIPILQYRETKDSIQFKRYVDEDTAVWESISVAAISDNKRFDKDNYIKQKTFCLGTDGLGRDMLSRLMIGSRISLWAGFVAVFVSLLIGVFLGAWAGYFGGWIDRLISWIMSINWALPTVLIAFSITLLLGKGTGQIMLAIGLSMWVNVARMVRGLVKSTKEMEYIQAARALGFSNSRILYKHILPNISSPLLVIAAGNFAAAIMLEAGLSFLGLGVQPPAPSWGGMLREHYQFLLTHQPLPAIIPGLAILMLVLAFNLVSNGLRDALDVKQS